MAASEGGVWVAFYSDRSDIVICASEIEALRIGVARSMQVVFWLFGLEWNEATK